MRRISIGIGIVLSGVFIVYFWRPLWSIFSERVFPPSRPVGQLVSPAPGEVDQSRTETFRIGVLPKDVPRDLIPRNAFQALSSRRITYPDGTVQVIATYYLAGSPDSIRQFYEDALGKGEWIINGRVTEDARIILRAVRQSAESLHVLAASASDGVIKVTMVYTKQ
ncbi:MAG: hypothetical protein Q8Q39_05740 [bacterium]|nr:hypothetical protein [bacterium]